MESDLFGPLHNYTNAFLQDNQKDMLYAQTHSITQSIEKTEYCE